MFPLLLLGGGIFLIWELMGASDNWKWKVLRVLGANGEARFGGKYIVWNESDSHVTSDGGFPSKELATQYAIRRYGKERAA